MLLNSSYEPIKLVSWKRAITLYFQEKVEIVERYDIHVNSSSTQFALPSIIRLKTYVKRKTRFVAHFSRSNVFKRDDHTCQYCNKVFGERDLTLDHVVPVSRGGKKTWENIVTACKSCNQRKANKTPKEANLTIKNPPIAPRWQPEIFYERFKLAFPESWRHYLGVV